MEPEFTGIHGFLAASSLTGFQVSSQFFVFLRPGVPSVVDPERVDGGIVPVNHAVRF